MSAGGEFITGCKNSPSNMALVTDQVALAVGQWLVVVLWWVMVWGVGSSGCGALDGAATVIGLWPFTSSRSSYGIGPGWFKPMWKLGQYRLCPPRSRQSIFSRVKYILLDESTLSCFIRNKSVNRSNRLNLPETIILNHANPPLLRKISLPLNHW